MYKLTISGNIGKSPEVKQTKNGKQMLVFNVGIYKDKDTTNWVQAIIMGDKRIEFFKDKLKSGTHVTVIGDASVGAYLKDGEPVGTQTIFANDISFINREQKLTNNSKESDDDPFRG